MTDIATDNRGTDIVYLRDYLRGHPTSPYASDIQDILKSGKEPAELCKIIREGEKQRTDLENRIRKTFGDYEFEIVWYYERSLDPDCELVDIKLKTKDGKVYMSNFTTTKFIEKTLNEDKKELSRGFKEEELAYGGGNHFVMPYLVIVRGITPEVVKKTIDSMIRNLEIEEYFEYIPDFQEAEDG